MRQAFIFIILSLLIFSAAGQKKFNLSGKVNIEDGSVSGSKIIFKDNKGNTKTVIPEKNGKYEFELDFNAEYEITFSKNNYVAKTMVINTNVPDKVLENKITYSWKTDVNLFKTLPGVNFEIFTQPVQKLYYFEKEKAFNYDSDYSKSIQKDLQFVMEEMEKVKKEIEEQKKEEEKAKQDALKNASKLISEGDRELSKNNYSQAQVLYMQAQELLPDNKDIKDKIASVEKLIKAQEGKQKQYDKLIAEADSKMAQANFEEAIDKYKEAAKLFPDKDYPKTKLADAQQSIERQKKSEQFNNILSEGDNALGNNNYTEAIKKYNEALKIQPESDDAKRKLNNAKRLQNELEAQQKAAEEARLKAEQEEDRYNQHVQQGDNAFIAKNYAGAVSEYRKALKIKPDDNQTKIKLEEAQDFLSAANSNKQKYDANISDGDKSFNSGDFQAAIEKYQQALSVTPDAEYPKSKIAAARQEIEKQNKNQEYQNLITKGDNAAVSKNFDEAETLYKQAQAIDNTDEVKQKIKNLENLRANALADAQAAEKEKNYNNLIKQADKLFDEENYLEAKGKYETALRLKPDENYPKQKLEEIKVAREAQKLEGKYNIIIKNADNSLNAGNLTQAENQYKEALQIKPDSDYAKQKLSEIFERKQKAAEAAKEREIEAKYNTEVKSADNHFDNERYDDAVTGYEKALEIKTTKYAQARLEEAKRRRAKARMEAERRRQEKAQAIAETEKRTQENSSVNHNKSELANIYFESDNDRKKYQTELAKKYPEGITIEYYEKGNKKIKRIIVNRNGIAKDYRKVSTPYGVFYSRDGENITEVVFNTGTQY